MIQRRLRTMKQGLVLAVGLVGLAGCASTGGNATDSTSGTDVAATSPAVLPADLKDDEGLVLAAAAGGVVEMRVLATGDSLQLPDGARVTIVSGMEEGQPLPSRAELTVRYEGAEGIVANPHIVRANNAYVNADGTALVSIAVRECVDTCRSDVWLWRLSGERVLVTDDASLEHAVSFSPDGRWVAIGSRELQVVSLLQMRITPYAEFTAPAYAPDGGLVVRGVAGNDAVYEIGEFGQGVEIARHKGKARSDAMALPVTFEDAGRSVLATFRRRGEDTTVAVSR